MAGSVYGKLFKAATFGESHGKAVGAVIEGCPAGLPLSALDIQRDLDRRKPGGSPFSSKRKEDDVCEILSGVFEGITAGGPIAVLINNTGQSSKDYSDIKDFYRPGHADYTYDMKYGFRDYRGGGRSSGRETAARVIGGAVARQILLSLNIHVIAYTLSIGPVSIAGNADITSRFDNPLIMPDNEAFLKASEYVLKLAESGNSAGGIARCTVKGLPVGIGEPVFDKLDAEIAKAVMSIGAVKGIEFGQGFASSRLTGFENNDSFAAEGKTIRKLTNNSGGVLGGISDGCDIVFNAAIKPTPSIALSQKSADGNFNNIEKQIKGRHDPVIVPRAIAVIEAMTCMAVCDLLLQNMTAKMDNLKKIYQNN